MPVPPLCSVGRGDNDNDGGNGPMRRSFSSCASCFVSRQIATRSAQTRRAPAPAQAPSRRHPQRCPRRLRRTPDSRR
jgi:hypothetical protein